VLSDELRSYQDGLEPGLAKANAMAMLAQSARLRDLDDEALDWVRRTVELTGHPAEPGTDLEQVELSALIERGALLTQRAATVEEGRALLGEVADRAEAGRYWLVAAFALNKLVHLPPLTSWKSLHELLERMRSVAERAGSEKFAVAAYYQGRARLFMQKGYLAGAIDAIQRGRALDLGYRRSVTRADVHGVFLAGLLLEANEVDRAADVLGQLSGVPGMEIARPGLAFHVASRRGDATKARALLSDVIAVVQSTGGRDGEFLHDLVSAALVAPLGIEEISKLVDGIDGPAVEPPYRGLVAGQVAEAGGDPGAALRHYLAAAEGGLPPAARGTAHVGAARCLMALHRTDEARRHALTACTLLDRWSGWRVEQLDAVRARLGLAGGATDDATAGLTPREREVATLIAAGLTNAELARRLFISPRTAAVHVSNILRKLGVASRNEVAAALKNM
jgi:DNA-binding CsgD family transcriptional regulator